MGVILLQEQELLPEMFCINIVQCFFFLLMKMSTQSNNKNIA